MPSIPLKHKCLSIILIWVIVALISSSGSKKSKKKNAFLIGENRHCIGEKRWLFLIGNGAEIRPLEKGRKSPVLTHLYFFRGLWTPPQERKTNQGPPHGPDKLREDILLQCLWKIIQIQIGAGQTLSCSFQTEVVSMYDLWKGILTERKP